MKIALVTGAAQGLGFETCRQLATKGYQVILTARNEAKGKAAAEKLQSLKLNVAFLQLDVTQDESVASAENHVRREYGRLDALVNNAGILIDTGGVWNAESASALKIPVEVLRQTFETNVYGAYRMCQKFAPLLCETAGKSDAACRIVNVSSGMGQLSEMNGGYPAYRISKTALNAVTRIFSEELAESHVLVNSICPGWVKTEMGGPEAQLSLEQGADTIVWAATLPADSPSGGFFRERKRIEW